MPDIKITLHSRNITSREFEEHVKLEVIARFGTFDFDVLIRSGFDKTTGDTIEEWDWKDRYSVNNFDKLMHSEQEQLQDYILELIHSEEAKLDSDDTSVSEDTI